APAGRGSAARGSRSRGPGAGRGRRRPLSRASHRPAARPGRGRRLGAHVAVGRTPTRARAIGGGGTAGRHLRRRRSVGGRARRAQWIHRSEPRSRSLRREARGPAAGRHAGAGLRARGTRPGRRRVDAGDDARSSRSHVSTRGLAWTTKLALQILAALALERAGWRVEALGVPGLGLVAAGGWSLPWTIAWVVFVTNALNLIDGLDGLACGVALVGSIAASFLL